MRILWWVLFVWASSAASQPVWFEADFTEGPMRSSWVGRIDHFEGVVRDGEVWLQTQGQPRADTLELAHPLAMAWGEWTFTVRWDGMTWSTANGIRVYLTASSTDLRGPQTGYFVQIGTNNTRDVRLVRQDGDPSQTSRRVSLISSSPLAEGTSGEVEVRVRRSFSGEWTLWVNAEPVGSTTDLRYTSSVATGVWVKHSATARAGIQVGRWSAQGFVTPPDTVPPTLLSHSVSEWPGGNRIELQFSEAVALADVPERSVAGVAMRIASRTETFSEGWTLESASLLPEGSWPFTLSDAQDRAGNEMRDTTVVLVIARDRVPPRIEVREVIDELSYRLRFSEPVFGACVRENFASTALGPPHEARCASAEPVAEVELRWASSLSRGTPDTLRTREIRDVAGNTLAVPWTLIGQPAEPVAGGLVLNEFLYSPDPLEFVEVLNRGTALLDLKDIRLSDDRNGRLPVGTGSYLLGPNEFALLARDRTALQAAFPETFALQVAGFPALNNTGDAIVIHTSTGVLLDSLSFSSSWGPAGRSLERIDPAAPPKPNNFAPSTHPSGATPGVENSRYRPDLEGPRLLLAEMRSGTQITLHFDEPVAVAPLPRVRASGEEGHVSSDPQLSHLLHVTFASLREVSHLDVGIVFDELGNASAPVRFPLARLAEAGELVLNEIHFDPVTVLGDAMPQQPEWIELFNASAHTLSLANLFITGDPSPTTGQVDTFRIVATPPVLTPGAYALIYQRHSSDSHPRTSSRFLSAYPSLPISDSTLVLIPVSQVTTGGLRLSGKRLRLERMGHVIDEVFYQPGWVNSSRTRTRGLSLERLHPALPSNSGLSWASSRDGEGGTPGRGNSQRPSGLPSPTSDDIAITEILFTPSPDRNQVAFIEIEHIGSRDVDLNGMLFVRSDTVRLVFEPYPLSPGERKVFFPVPSVWNALPDTRAAFRAAFPDAPLATLFPVRSSAFSLLTTSARIQVLSPARTLIESLSYSSAWHDPQVSPSGRSIERISTLQPAERAENWGSSQAASGSTPGLVNSFRSHPEARPPRPGDVVINEILYEPNTNAEDGIPDQTDFIELLNISSELLDLNGLQFVRMPDEVGRADTVRLVFRPTLLPPGEFAVVIAQTGTYSHHPHPANLFREAYALGAGVTVVPVRASTFTLVSAGAHIGIQTAEGVLLESVPYRPEWHSRTLHLSRGVSLERRDPLAASSLPHNWGSSADAQGATPGRINSLSVQDDEAYPSAGLVVTPSPFTPELGTFIRYRLRAPDATVRVRMFDLQGRLVRELTQGALSGPQGVLHWDGLGDAGEALRIGPYVVHLEAVSAESGAVEVYRKPAILARPLGR